MSAIVKYNGITLNPPPYVSLSTEKVDYGNRWGLIKNYTLNGQLQIGSQSTAVISDLTNVFLNNFKGFSVVDAGVTYINEACVHVDSMSISADKFKNYGNSIGYIPYSVQLKSYDVTSGVMEPSDEWSFKENDDKNIDVTHKVSARAIRTGSSNTAKTDVYNFVNTFLPKVGGVRARPGQECSIPAGVSTTNNINNSSYLKHMTLMGESESFDRLTSTLSVSQNFKSSNAKINGNWVFMKSGATLQNSTDQEYPTASLSIEMFGSEAALTGLKADGLIGYTAYRQGVADLLGDSANVKSFFQTSFKVSDEPNSNSIKLDVEFIRANETYANFYSGFFDYKVDMSEDSVTHLRTYNVNGNFVCKGNLQHRTDRLNSFVNAMSSYDAYLYTLASDYATALSASFSSDNVIHSVNPQPKTTSVTSNTNQASLALSASFSDLDFIEGIYDLKYNVGVELPIKVYRTIDSATVNGHHVVQEFLGCANSEKINVSVDATYEGNKNTVIPGGNSIEEEISFVFDRVEGIMGGAQSFQTSESNDKNNYDALSSFSEKKSYTLINRAAIGQSTFLNSNEVYANSDGSDMNAGAAKQRLPGRQYGE